MIEWWMPPLFAALFALAGGTAPLWLPKLLEHKAAKPDVFYEMQHPATDELRAVYREIDHDAGLTVEEILTPEKPVSVSKWMEGKHVEQFWVNLLWSDGGRSGYREADLERQKVSAMETATGYDIITTVEFPRWEQGPGTVMGALFLKAKKGSPWITVVGEAKSVQPGDVVRINAVKQHELRAGA